MLEPKTLKKTPVPDPAQVPPKTRRLLLDLVDKRLSAPWPEARDLEKQIDELIADLYGLSPQERRALGMGG